MWIFGVLVGQAVLVGIIAQRRYKRIGLLWFFFALGIGVGLSMFLDRAITSDPRYILDADYRNSLSTFGHDVAFVLLTSLPAFLLTWIALATLPSKDAG